MKKKNKPATKQKTGRKQAVASSEQQPLVLCRMPAEQIWTVTPCSCLVLPEPSLQNSYPGHNGKQC